MIARFTSIIATVSLLCASVKASGMVSQVIDANNFCVYLPPSDSTDRIISDTEWNANAFCLGDTPLAVGADKLPSGFITSAHYVKTDAYVQVTGQMDYSKANLVATDEGGQMDIKAPVGSSCAGWDYYVNLIEPVSNTYCMRCCNDTVSCNRGISEKGCAHIIPGDYSGPNGSSTDASSSSTDTVASSSATATDAASSAAASSSSSSAAVASSSSAVVASSSAVVSSSSAVVTSSPISTPPSASSSAPNGVVSEQSVNAAGSNKPLSLTVGAGAALLMSAVFMA